MPERWLIDESLGWRADITSKRFIYLFVKFYHKKTRQIVADGELVFV